MNCDDALLLLSGHLDGSNTPEEEAALQAHLSECEACNEMLRAYEEADAGISSLKEPAPAALCADVMAQIKRETVKKRRRPWYGIAIAAALTLVIGVSAAVDIHEEAEEPQTVSDAAVYAVGREVPAADSDTLAVQIARERGAAVIVIHELFYEVETYPCQTLDEGYLLYVLPNYDLAAELAESYGCKLYEPTEKTDNAVSYALLAP